MRASQLAAGGDDRGHRYSAKSLKRPGIQWALDRLKAGEAEVLVTAKLDRLSRSMLDFAGIMADAQKQSWAVVCLDLEVNTTTPAGEVTANMLAFFAQFKASSYWSEDQRCTGSEACRRCRRGRVRETPDAVVDRIVREREGKATLRAIANGLNRDGVPTVRGGKRWWPTAVSSVLRSVEYERELATS